MRREPTLEDGPRGRPGTGAVAAVLAEVVEFLGSRPAVCSGLLSASR